ncbi:uncharacterized protein LOC126293504 [Schistocerca gregaria]|uniref:uncharacterized protein LOC126293504 n=1 Tax=Schistocerca gregaria TaxID=7010 RepID=UPI00211E4278|nr:uncharacterized protein LOC126293504 [Schistocerca gregaria]
MLETDEALYSVRHPEYKNRLRKLMQKIKSGASAQVAYTPQVYWFLMLKFLDESVSNIESTESKSERATPTFEEMFECEIQALQEPSVACSEPQRRHQERPPRKRRKGTTDVATDIIVEATRTLKTVADMARTLPRPVQEDRYSALATHFTAELHKMDNVSGTEFLMGTIHSLQWCLMDRWDFLHATAQQAQLSASAYIQVALKWAGIEEDDTIL